MHKITIMGNSTKDGEQKPYGNAKTLTRFGIADNYKDKKGEKQVIFWNCVIFKPVDIVRGKAYEVEGRLEVVKKDDKTYINVIAFHVSEKHWEDRGNPITPDDTTEEKLPF